MNLLSRQIKQCMSPITETSDGKVVAKFIFPSDFIGFQGHFPNKPILPGICKILASLVILQARNQKKVRLKEIVLAKFFSSVSYNEEVTFECCECPGEHDKALVKVWVTGNGNKVAELQLRVQYE